MFRKNKMGYNHRKRLKSVSKGETERDGGKRKVREKKRNRERYRG